MKKNHNSVALPLGLFFAFVHFLWLVMVALQMAKPMMDWLLGLHHIEFQYAMLPFNLGNAALLLVVTFVVGYVAGWILSFFWSWFAKK